MKQEWCYPTLSSCGNYVSQRLECFTYDEHKGTGLKLQNLGVKSRRIYNLKPVYILNLPLPHLQKKKMGMRIQVSQHSGCLIGTKLWVSFLRPYKPDITAPSYNPGIQEGNQEDRKFKIILECIVSLRPAKATWTLVQKRKEGREGRRDREKKKTKKQREKLTLCLEHTKIALPMTKYL